MKGLIIFLGESFRLGGQFNRNIGTDESYAEQIKACKSHVELINKLENEGYKIDTYISTYSTKFDKDILEIYKDSLVGYTIIDNNIRIGYNNLFHNSIQNIKDLDTYSFIVFFRVDLCLKKTFYNVFNPHWQTIRFPFVCFKTWLGKTGWHKVGKFPRIGDTIIFFPNKYYSYIKNIIFIGDGHANWKHLIEDGGLSTEDLDTMINTYHDTDSAKDYNPLYYVVNRPEVITHLTPGEIFDKYNFD